MTQEAIKMGMTAEDLAVIEKAYRENPDDMKARVAYLEAGIREVRARLERPYGSVERTACDSCALWTRRSRTDAAGNR